MKKHLIENRRVLGRLLAREVEPRELGKVLGQGITQVCGGTVTSFGQGNIDCTGAPSIDHPPPV